MKIYPDQDIAAGNASVPFLRPHVSPALGRNAKGGGMLNTSLFSLSPRERAGVRGTADTSPSHAAPSPSPVSCSDY